MTLTTSGDAVVRAEELYEASRRAITLTVDDLWPGRGAVLGAQVPSLTSYVCPVTVDGEELFAKYGWLSTPMASVLRGARGTWDDVLEAQLPYTRSADLLTRREFQQLEFLRQLGRPRVCEAVDFRAGVLLTRALSGMTVAEEINLRPWDTGPLLDSVLLSLPELHGEAGAKYIKRAWPINERSIVDVFLHQFKGPSAAGFVADLGRDRELPEHERLVIVDLVANAVRRLIRLTTALRPRQRVAVYGDLKPEHVFLSGARMTFISPALQWAAGPEPDVAKLIGRALLLGLCHHELRAEQQITQGVASTLDSYFGALPRGERLDQVREVMVLWLMDTAALLATCLSVPADYPVTAHQEQVVRHARRIATVLDRVSGLLIGSMTGAGLLDAIFGEFDQTAWNPLRAGRHSATPTSIEGNDA
ncbi:hypothetical protein ACH4RG_22880 [Streptomyces sp. NPDC021019]|uniref:hypothetical protein n=1 Tax=Streptomyces sp. NPDC021019 TaxID=3365108 RepID=UPI0037A0E501